MHWGKVNSMGNDTSSSDEEKGVGFRVQMIDY